MLLLNLLIAFISIQHLGFLFLEMVLWQKPIGMKIFRMSPEMAKQTAAMAANQGLYNGFLAAGLCWGLLSPSLETGLSVKVFFLSCVVIAGIFGGLTVARKIIFIQALPAALALILIFSFS